MDNEQIKQAQDNAIQKYEAGGSMVKCANCGSTSDLRLATEKSNFTHRKSAKKTGKEKPILDKNGDKIYFCLQCLQTRAKELQKKRNV